MENLRAFMIVSDVRDSGTQFLYQPEDLESNTARSPEIAENGFTMYFAAENERKAAIPLISDLGFVKTYQEIDAAPAPEAQRDEKQEPAPEATGQTEPQKAAPAAGAEATSGKGSGTPDQAKPDQCQSVQAGSADGRGGRNRNYGDNGDRVAGPARDRGCQTG